MGKINLRIFENTYFKSFASLNKKSLIFYGKSHFSVQKICKNLTDLKYKGWNFSIFLNC